MKKLVLGFVIAVSLMIGLAGAAGATEPDINACLGTSGHDGFGVVSVLGTGSCEDHRA